MMPPIVAGAFVAAAAAVVAKVVASEWHRINAMLHPQQPEPVRETVRQKLPTLRRDPRTGIYRPD
jgi:hypothetical protein